MTRQVTMCFRKLWWYGVYFACKLTSIYKPQPSIVLSFSPEMTSPTTSGRQQIEQRVNFRSCSSCDFSITAQPISKKVYCFVNNGSSASFAVVQVIGRFCFMAPKLGPKRTYCSQGVTQLADYAAFLQNCRSQQLANSLHGSPESLYIVTGNDVIEYVQSTANSVNAAGAPPNSSPGNIFPNLPSRNSLFITAENDATIYFRSAARRIITPMFNYFCRLCRRRVSYCPPIGGLSCFIFIMNYLS